MIGEPGQFARRPAAEECRHGRGPVTTLKQTTAEVIAMGKPVKYRRVITNNVRVIVVEIQISSKGRRK